ncbi:hypothetical protein B0T26DRAFT_475521 [Lasiosphaeria miniovina]|uniref:Uncharacterized protein n=1 Tax=Lasiosphaeria miniovina TaxID=1954250 RepID=A0AA40A090_9PEZI|nr:uncharacterized protein B0T26DRAFT_475521 [Lasiosphaeria miniovina]KAK0706830.1 hypothetical protein B0T26DRAFT_475521 [Lasiosphaeria miniovina]
MLFPSFFLLLIVLRVLFICLLPLLLLSPAPLYRQTGQARSPVVVVLLVSHSLLPCRACVPASKTGATRAHGFLDGKHGFEKPCTFNLQPWGCVCTYLGMCERGKTNSELHKRICNMYAFVRCHRSSAQAGALWCSHGRGESWNRVFVGLRFVAYIKGGRLLFLSVRPWPVCVPPHTPIAHTDRPDHPYTAAVCLWAYVFAWGWVILSSGLLVCRSSGPLYFAVGCWPVGCGWKY